VGANAVRFTPEFVVNLEDTVVVGAVLVLFARNAGTVRALVLGNAGPLAELVTGNTQLGHLTGQGAAIHGATESGSDTSQCNQNDESLHD